MEDILTPEQWNRNVGTGSNPVTFLHEYAVGLIRDMLQNGINDKEPVSLPLIDGTTAENVLDGIARVTLPDPLQPIGGYVPDLALFNDDLKVIRVIEVVVTSPPTQEKLDNLTKRGVEVLQVPARNEAELRALLPYHLQGRRIRWWHQAHRRDGRGAGRNFQSQRDAQNKADREIDAIIKSLVRSSPAKRREFLAVLEELNSLDSLYTLRPDNPKRGKLREHN